MLSVLSGNPKDQGWGFLLLQDYVDDEIFSSDSGAACRRTAAEKKSDVAWFSSTWELAALCAEEPRGWHGACSPSPQYPSLAALVPLSCPAVDREVYVVLTAVKWGPNCPAWVH